MTAQLESIISARMNTFAVIVVCKVGVSVTDGYVGDQCGGCSSMPTAQCQLSADHHHHCSHHHPQHQHQQPAAAPVYCRLTDDGVADSSLSSSIDIQFMQSSAASSLTSQRPAQLTRWKPVANIPERWSKEMSHDDSSCECRQWIRVLCMRRLA